MHITQDRWNHPEPTPTPRSLPTRPEAEETLHAAEKALAQFDHRYGRFIKAADERATEFEDVDLHLKDGSPSPWLYRRRSERSELKRAAQQARETFDLRTRLNAEALESQTVRYAVAPRRRIASTAIGDALEAGDELQPGRSSALEIRRFIRLGYLLAKQPHTSDCVA